MRAGTFAGLAAAALVCGLVAQVSAKQASAPAPLDGGRFVDVRGGRLHVVVLEPHGKASGATLLLLHGASSNLKDMQESIGRRLARRHRVILVDRPGHGRSDRLGGREMSSPAKQADAIAEALDRLSVGRTVVVAHSWSGALALNLALDHPAHVSGLALLAPATHPWRGEVAWYNSLAATPVLGAAFAVTLLGPIGAARFEDGLKSTFAPHDPPPNYVAVTDAKLLLRPSEFTANAEDITDLKSFVAAQAPRYGAIRVPTVIVTADKDDVVSPEVHSRPLHRQIRGSKLVVLKDAGHTVQWNATARVVREIEAVAAKAGT